MTNAIPALQSVQAELGIGPGPLGEPPVPDFLRILRREIANDILPDPSSAQSRTLLEMSLMLLDYLAQRADRLDAVLRDRNYALAKSLGTTAGSDPLIALEDRLKQASDIEFPALLKAICSADLSVLNAIELGNGNDKPPSDDLAAAARRFEEHLRSQSGFHSALVIELRKLVGGYSKDVYLCTFDRGAGSEKLVVRCDRRDGPLETSVSDEYPAIKAAEANGVPVASALWLHVSPDVLGGPFLVSEFVEGTPGTDFKGEMMSDDAAEVYRQLAVVMGKLHSINVAEVGGRAELLQQPTGTLITNLIDRYEAQWKRRRRAPSPTISGALEWMRRNVPAEHVRACLVHGDPTPRNLLLTNGRVRALLDWETWHLGDPAEDLAYIREEMPRALSWQEFNQIYLANGGVEVSDERLHYWSHWKFLFGSISAVSMMSGIGTDRDIDLRTAFGAVYFTKYCVGRVGEQMLKA